jgi:hypothetical protein
MASNARILNLTNGRRIKRNQALGRVEQCISAWVEPNVSIRDLTLQESIAKRSEEARASVPLASAEIPGLVFEPPANAIAGTRLEHQRLAEANAFAIGFLGKNPL